MPHPARLDPEDIARTARELLEKGGPEAVTMRELARRLGVQAPSLYFHVQNRDALLRRLSEQGFAELGARLSEAAAGAGSVSESFHALAEAYARFAFDQPQLFLLLFGPCIEERRAGADFGERASAPLFAALRLAGVDEERLLDASQAMWSLVHGYTVLALGDQFQLGGDPRRALHAAVDALLAGLADVGCNSVRKVE